MYGVRLSVLFKYIFRYIAVFVIEICMFLKSCIEVDFDVEFLVFFAYMNTVYKQAEVGIAYGTLLNDPFDYVNGFFDFRFSFLYGGIVILYRLYFRFYAFYIFFTFCKHFGVNIGSITVTDTFEQYFFLVVFELGKRFGKLFNSVPDSAFLIQPSLDI